MRRTKKQALYRIPRRSAAEAAARRGGARSPSYRGSITCTMAIRIRFAKHCLQSNAGWTILLVIPMNTALSAARRLAAGALAIGFSQAIARGASRSLNSR